MSNGYSPCSLRKLQKESWILTGTQRKLIRGQIVLTTIFIGLSELSISKIDMIRAPVGAGPSVTWTPALK